MSDYITQADTFMVESDSGNFAICLDKASPDVNSYMAKVDSKFVKARAATPEEIATATKRLESLVKNAAVAKAKLAEEAAKAATPAAPTTPAATPTA